MAKSPDRKKPDKQKIISEFQAIFDDRLNPVRAILERTWFRNILYYLGEQWLLWFQAQGTFGRRYEMNMTIPTPVANMIRDYVRSMKALIMNKKFVTKIWPNSNQQDDKDAAEMGEHLIRWLDTKNDGEIEDIKELIAIWVVIAGNAFGRVFPDKDNGMFVRDKAGSVVNQAIDIATESVIPFNVLVDPLGLSLRQKRYIGIKSLKYVEWAEDTFGVKITGSDSDYQAVDYQRQLMTMVGNVSPWKGRGFETSMLEIPSDKMIVFKEIEYRPTKEYPEGRYQVMAGDQLLVNDDHLPIPVEKTGEWYYTLTHFSYNPTPGSFWATGGVDDIISPQNTVNEIDQGLAANRKSLGRPLVMTPGEISLKRMSAKGQALLHISYDGRMAAGAKPIIQAGVPYPQQVMEERSLNKETVQEVAGDPKNVLRGQSPHSGASGVLVDILRETAEQSHSPDIERFYRAWNRQNKKKVILAKHIFTSTRLLKIPGKGNEIMVKRFLGADLRDNTDVRFELDSGLSTTNAGKNQFLSSLIRDKFWGEDITLHPEVQRELLKRMGMSGFPEEQNIHRERAEYENSIIADGSKKDLERIAFPIMLIPDPNSETGEPLLDNKTGQPISLFPEGEDPVFRLDPHDLHIKVHDSLIFSREFLAWKEDKQMMLIAHRDLHQAALDQERLANEEKLLELAQQGIPPEEVGGEAGVGPGGPGGPGGGPNGGQSSPQPPPGEAVEQAGGGQKPL
ncbi:hypothetical protein LCGC14_1229170 [marine sediment metagenome]|uniref:Portal protein n=1 Tax=marine sediment metagenome TaxID=412755 RepID=A0A0F9NRC4_9ZZZZ